MYKISRLMPRLLALAIGSLVLAIFGQTVVEAANPQTLESLTDTTVKLQISIDTVWVMLTGFLVFFMQTGFAMLEAGLVRQTGAVNILIENFIDAGVTIIAWWAVGFGLAFGTSTNGLIGTDNFFLSNAFTFHDGVINYAMGAGGSNAGITTLTLFFFQFAFATTASAITTGAMAERTDFIGDLIYSTIMGAISYPIIAHWVWNNGGWLNKMGYHDFAGSSVVHVVGGFTALVGAYFLGPRPNRIWHQPPPANNLGLATIGTMILWFGWFGFNPGSTLGTTNPGLIGLVTINTTLSAGAGALSALLYVFFRIRKWHLFCGLNGSLAGLVAITGGCAFLMPWAAVIVGAIAGVLAIIAVDVIEGFKIDDPVGAFAVHGCNGMLGILAIGLFGQPELTITKKAGLLLGGGFDLLGIQVIGLTVIMVFTVTFSWLMFSVLKYLGRLRVAPKADVIGIDVYEHGASMCPDIYPIDHLLDAEDNDDISTAGLSLRN